MSKTKITCLLFILILALVHSNFVNGTEIAKNIVINEVMSANVLTIRDADGDSSDWIELYNPTSEIIDLSGFYLSDKGKNKRKWQIPEGTKISGNGFFLIWASGKDKISTTGELHTNFSISAKGEPIILTAPDGTTLVDYVIVPPLGSDISCGRKPDGSYNWVFFNVDNASPGFSNDLWESHIPPNQRFNPIFSQASGFYQEEFTLELSSLAEVKIYYTLDGSLPDPILNMNNTFLPWVVIKRNCRNKLGN